MYPSKVNEYSHNKGRTMGNVLLRPSCTLGQRECMAGFTQAKGKHRLGTGEGTSTTELLLLPSGRSITQDPRYSR